MMDFTVEQVNFMCVFNTDNRKALMDGIRYSMPVFYEPELLEIAQNTLRKLEEMSDEEFDALEFYPVSEDDDEAEV